MYKSAIWRHSVKHGQNPSLCNSLVNHDTCILISSQTPFPILNHLKNPPFQIWIMVKKNLQWTRFFSLPQRYLYFIVCATQTEAGSHNRVLNHNSETLWRPQLQQQVSSLYRGAQQSRCLTRILTPSSNSSWNSQSQLSIFVCFFFLNRKFQNYDIKSS